MQALTLSTMAMFRVDRVTMELEGNVPAPTLPTLAIADGAKES